MLSMNRDRSLAMPPDKLITRLVFVLPVSIAAIVPALFCRKDITPRAADAQKDAAAARHFAFACGPRLLFDIAAMQHHGVWRLACALKENAPGLSSGSMIKTNLNVA